ncbi:MAG: hypothetical protein LGR52_11835, partial [Candidatus Thiosymbion ectosymbiont of Robbea hypermnestra]|nr:hypothetical protein [Candidatus Thiosymbion ectosymbiont of Robbea hypermnestra]
QNRNLFWLFPGFGVYTQGQQNYNTTEPWTGPHRTGQGFVVVVKTLWRTRTMMIEGREMSKTNPGSGTERSGRVPQGVG